MQSVEVGKPLRPQDLMFWNSASLEGYALELAEILLRQRTNYLGWTLEHVQQRIAEGTWRIHILEEPGLELWLLTYIADAPSGKELQVLEMTGKGLTRQYKRVAEAVQVVAKAYGCRWIWTMTSNKTVMKLLQKAKMTELGTCFVMEVPGVKRA